MLGDHTCNASADTLCNLSKQRLTSCTWRSTMLNVQQLRSTPCDNKGDLKGAEMGPVRDALQPVKLLDALEEAIVSPHSRVQLWTLPYPPRQHNRGVSSRVLRMAGILAGKAALITGSTSGIGLAMARALAGAGANVCLHGLGDLSAIQKVQDELQSAHGVKTAYSDADLKKPALIRDMVKQAHEEFGRLDILVNNAGIQYVSPVEDFPEDKWDDIIAVCLNSAFHATKAALPYMLQQGWGRIVNTGSMHALVASPYKSAYNAAKHGIAGFTKTVALEMAQRNITCNAICPGYVLTDLVKNQLQDTARVRGMTVEQVVEKVLLADQPTKQFVKPEDLAAMVVHLCGPHSSSITGACLSIDGGWTAR